MTVGLSSRVNGRAKCLALAFTHTIVALAKSIPVINVLG